MKFLNKFMGLLFKPKEAINSIEVNPREVSTIVIATILVRGIQAWADIPIIYDDFDLAKFVLPLNAMVFISIYWLGITWVYHYSAIRAGNDGKYIELLSVFGYTLLPYFLAVIASTLLFFFAPILFPNLSVINVKFFQITIEEGGMLWGLRGLMAYWAVQRVYTISPERALFTTVILNLVVIGANVYFFLSGSPYNY